MIVELTRSAAIVPEVKKALCIKKNNDLPSGVDVMPATAGL